MTKKYACVTQQRGAGIPGIIALAFIVYMLGAFPHMVMAIYGTSSLAFGIVLYVSFILLFLYRYVPSLLKAHPFFVVSFFILFFYISVQILYNNGLNFKSYSSMALLLFVLAVAHLSAVKLEKINNLLLANALGFLVMALIFTGLANLLFDFKFMGYRHPMAVVPFSEPSHYALFSGWIFVAGFTFFNHRLRKVAILMACFFMALILPNLTLLIYVILMLLIIIRLKPQNLLIFFLTISCIVLVFNLNSYFYDRVDVFSDGPNLSALVYMQGVSDALKSLQLTNSLGLGFQMLGTQPPSSVAELISTALGDNNGELNRKDGGFLAAKIIAELGVLGICIVIICIYFMVNSLIYLRNIVKTKGKGADIKLVIVHSIVYSFIVELLIRGYGYFSPGVFMFFMSLVYLFKYRKYQVYDLKNNSFNRSENFRHEN